MGSIGAPRALPSLDADLEVAPLGIGRTQLAIGRGTSRPSAHSVVRWIGRPVQGGEATVKDFLDRVAESVLQPPAEAAVLGHDEPSGVGS